MFLYLGDSRIRRLKRLLAELRDNDLHGAESCGEYEVACKVLDALGLDAFHFYASHDGHHGVEIRLHICNVTPEDSPASSNDNYDAILKDALLSVARNPDTPYGVLEELVRDPSPNIRAAVAGNPSTDSRNMYLLAEDEDVSVRIALARNPNTPIDVLDFLIKDEDEDWRVRRIARKALHRRGIG